MSTVTGYDTEDTFFATRYKQGGRRVYAIDLSLAQIAGYLPAPDPDRPTEGNRRIKLSHATGFANYIREHPEWVSPALLLRAPDIFTFEALQEIQGTEFGIMSMPRLARTDLHILDGQHRILGIHLAIDQIAADLASERDKRAAAKRTDAEPAVVKQFEGRIHELEDQRERLGRERISLEILIEEDSQRYKQMFFDIADNALGITSSVRARFDSRKVVNRSLEEVLKHSMLKGLVDPEQDRILGASKYLMGAKHVADIVRTLAVGISGRIGRRLEDELREDELVERTNDYLDTLLAAFPQLAAVADRELTPEALRAGSLLGSTTFLRVLAGVYYELTQVQRNDAEEVTEFLEKLVPHLSAPVATDSVWIEHTRGDVFVEGARAPKARNQDMKSLTADIVRWAVDRPDWLSKPMGDKQAAA